MDYLGMKIQFTREIAACYRAARADAANDDNVTHNLRRIRGMDGLLPSLRDYIHQIKRMYHDVWLLENRPYWLDNVLVRYDAEALYWVRQMQVFDGAAREAEATRTLPDAEKLGLFRGRTRGCDENRNPAGQRAGGVRPAVQVWDGAAREVEATRILYDAEKLGLFLTPDKGMR